MHELLQTDAEYAQTLPRPRTRRGEGAILSTMNGIIPVIVKSPRRRHSRRQVTHRTAAIRQNRRNAARSASTRQPKSPPDPT